MKCELCQECRKFVALSCIEKHVRRQNIKHVSIRPAKVKRKRMSLLQTLLELVPNRTNK